MHLCTPIPSEMLAFELNDDDTLEGLPPLDFQQECQIWTSLTIEVKSSQVTFIYLALLTIQIVTKHCTISK